MKRVAQSVSNEFIGFAMRHIVFLILVLASEPARADDRAVAPDFSKYPQTEAFKYYLSVHTNAAWNRQQTNILVVSAFPEGSRYALQYFVTETGQASDHREVYNWATQASHWKQLSEATLSNLRSAIGQLPAESVSPPIDRLVIVSFRERTNWTTRSYDCDTLPRPMRQIYDIIGERFESRKDK